MNADWEMDLGAGAPVIDAAWDGFVDLRIEPERVNQIEEVRLLPGLASALVRLNARAAPVWTAKCDVWRVEEPLDPFEIDAEPEQNAAVACYIDLLPRSDQQWRLPQRAADACRAITERLRGVQLRACRVDLVVRLAQITPEVQDLGITAYVAACGVSQQAARAQLTAAVAALADTITGPEDATKSPSPLQ
jgi:hypothetical protein